jgi:hypothetical protein
MLRQDEHMCFTWFGPPEHSAQHIAMCVVLFKAELNLSLSIVCMTFYSSRSWQLQCDLGPDRWA